MPKLKLDFDYVAAKKMLFWFMVAVVYRRNIIRKSNFGSGIFQKLGFQKRCFKYF